MSLKVEYVVKTFFVLSFRLIYKCSMCDTVFTQQTLLQSHFDQHIANQKVSVFKCPDCSMHYAQKQLMLDHIKVLYEGGNIFFSCGRCEQITYLTYKNL